MGKEKKDIAIIQLKTFINISKALRNLFSMYYIYEDGYIYGPSAETCDWIVTIAKPTKPITAYQNLLVNAMDVYTKIKDLKMTYTTASHKSNIVTLSDTRNNVEPAVFYQISEDIDEFIERSIKKDVIYRYLIDKKNLNADDYKKIPKDGVDLIYGGSLYENTDNDFYFRLTKELFPHIKKDTSISYRVSVILPSSSPRYNKTYLTFKSSTPSLDIDIYSMVCIRTMN